jgi:hypothetical protein
MPFRKKVVGWQRILLGIFGPHRDSYTRRRAGRRKCAWQLGIVQMEVSALAFEDERPWRTSRDALKLCFCVVSLHDQRRSGDKAVQ